MTLVDTSAWVEFLRDTGTPTCERVRQLLASDIAICDVMRMEVFSGARDPWHLRQLRWLMSRATLIRTESIDFLEAAAIYRRSRRGGVAVRKLVDCLICAVAIRAGATVLHRDKDFDLIARHTAIRLDRSEDRAGP